MAEQCIVCLENLDAESPLTPQFSPVVDESLDPPETAEVAVVDDEDSSSSNTVKPAPEHHNNHNDIAFIQVCGHMLHDSCLREWSVKANSCPICRQSFHQVQVYNKVGGTLLSSYRVEDKKQVAEFDPQAWIEDNPDDEEQTFPCPVCNRGDREEVLLLCDGCDTPYHTFCIGLDSVPRGAWFCMECVDHLGPEVTEAAPPPRTRTANRSPFFPRTQASMRQARRRARSDDWQGAWGRIAGRVWDALSIDLDYNEDDALEEYRRSQQARERDRQEHERWQQRLNIASRLGARDVFANNIQNVLGPRPSATTRPQPAEQTREERRAWGSFERALERDESNSGSRKRKSRSITASPREPRQEQEPERKLKRPRTRRLPVQNGEALSPNPAVATPSNRPAAGRPARNARSPSGAGVPSFLSSLLKEVETSTPSDDESIRHLFGPIPGANDASSPASSPSPSAYSSPRASSSTPPPPQRQARPTSPIMSLSSHIEPIYPPANYSPTRSSPENSDSEQHNHRAVAANAATLELREPRPRRSRPVRLPRSQDASPTRSPLPLETKQSINSIVRNVLKPHWKSSKLTSEQYATINRDVSRKLYEGVADGASIDDEARQAWEAAAKREVTSAISGLKAS